MNDNSTKQSEQQYTQGVYAGPLTQRATDYNGHEAIGIQVSDPAADGSCFFLTLDEHMQASIIPVIAASIRSYDPPEPPSDPECTAEDLRETQTRLEELMESLFEHPPKTRIPSELFARAMILSELARVIMVQMNRFDDNLAAIQKGVKP